MDILELCEYNSSRVCLLNTATNEKRFYEFNEKYIKGFTGVYFISENHFFALFPSSQGAMGFYNGKTFPITPQLTTTWEKHGNRRLLEIPQYNIKIEYDRIPFGIGWWETEESDNDLLCNLYEKYQTKEFNEQYTTEQQYDLSNEFVLLGKKSIEE